MKQFYFKKINEKYVSLNPSDYKAGKYEWERANAMRKDADVVVSTDNEDMVQKILAKQVDVVSITCSCETDLMERGEAISLYEEAVICCEGSEQSRYLNILIGLKSGSIVISDEY